MLEDPHSHSSSDPHAQTCLEDFYSIPSKIFVDLCLISIKNQANSSGTNDNLLPKFLQTPSFFDVTPLTLKKLYSNFDVDKDGSVTLDEFMEGLRTVRFDFTSEEANSGNKPLNELVQALRVITGATKNEDVRIEFPLFAHIVKQLKLHLLFEESVVKGSFKKLRIERLMKLSAGVRYLRKQQEKLRAAAKSTPTPTPAPAPALFPTPTPRKFKLKNLFKTNIQGKYNQSFRFSKKAGTGDATIFFDEMNIYDAEEDDGTGIQSVRSLKDVANKIIEEETVILKMGSILHETEEEKDKKHELEFDRSLAIREKSIELVLSDVSTLDDKVLKSSLDDVIRAKHDLGVKLSLFDYSNAHYFCRLDINKDLNSLNKFYTTPKQENFDSRRFAVRWISLESFDALSLLRLAVKFELHPLATKDVLTINRQQLKISEYGKHFSIIVPCICLSRRSLQSLSKYERVRLARKSRKQAHRLQKSGIVSRTAEWLNGIIRQAQSEEDRYESLFGGGVGKITVDVESSRIAILMSTKYDHLLSFETGFQKRADDNEVDESSSDDEEGGSSSSDDEDSGDSDDDIMSSERIKADMQSTFKSVRKDLLHDHSAIRSNDANFLLYKMMNAIVNKLPPIAKGYRLKIELLSISLNKSFEGKTKKYQKSFLLKLSRLNREVAWVLDKVRPVKRILRHLIDDERIGDELSVYFEDLEDNVVIVVTELEKICEYVGSTKVDFDNFQDRRMNEILYILTFTTVCILPAQFLTGLFGMNFVDVETGEPNMPLLTWKRGYIFFWVLSILLSILVILIFKWKKWL